MEQNKVKKSKIPYFFFAFFAVVFAVDIFYIYISKKTWRGVVIEDSYQRGLKYNEVLDAQKKQQSLGWKAKVFFDNKGNKSGILTFELLDENLRNIADAKVTVELRRPAQEGFDFNKEMKVDGNQYIADIDFPLKGQWDFIVTAALDQNSFVESKRYVVQ
ncbi:MAG: hypothetical protein FJ368_05360 [Pelagibacterales bacterium]|nr:hypothetical protein [Pelagibacterales bacterium]